MADQNDPASSGVSVDETLGDYHLRRLLYKGTMTKTYRARQCSVDRDVILVRMLPTAVKDIDIVNGFLADVKAKAKLNHPIIGKVYEAVQKDNEIFFTKEELPGKTLEDVIEAEEKLTPLEVARVLRAIAEVMAHCEAHNTAIVPIAPHYVHLGKAIRIATIAIAGEPTEAAYLQSRYYTGDLLLDVLSNEGKGQTRISQLLGYMAKRNASQPLQWSDVLRKVLAIVESTRDGAEDLAAPTERMTTNLLTYRVPFHVWKSIVRTVAGAVAVVAAVSIAVAFQQEVSPIERAKNNPPVRIPAGDYESPQGASFTVKAFEMDAHEVTIAEYQEFIEELESLAPRNRNAYDHPDQPEYKKDHLPRGWFGIKEALEFLDEDGKKRVASDFPIVSIDWWDAYAYARWKGRRLPTNEEWVAATSKIINTKKIYDRWTSVGRNQQDIGYQGIVDLAGGVREWLQDKEVNPAFPHSEPQAVAAGASFDAPYDGIYARHYISSYNETAKDLGFRTVKSENSE